MKPYISLILSLVASAGVVRAHHGRDFLLLQDYNVPVPFAGVITGGYSFESGEGGDESTVETGVFTGVAPRAGLGLNLGAGDYGDGWDFSSVSPYTQIQLTPPTAKFPVRVALIAGYQFAVNGEDGRDAEAGHDDHHDEHDAHEEAGGHDDADVLHGHTHAAGGIHQHGVSQFFGRLIVETDLTAADKVLFNLIAIVPEGGKAEWGYAGGYRHSFSHAVALGVEAIGDFGEANQHELMAGAYLAPTHTVLVRLGVGFGLTEESPDYTLRGGLVWRF